jgi:hypothetical protein
LLCSKKKNMYAVIVFLYSVLIQALSARPNGWYDDSTSCTNQYWVLSTKY